MRSGVTREDAIFRHFQIQKFDPMRIAPAVTMMINVNASPLLVLRQKLNNRADFASHITVTHMVIKAVAQTLVQYPVLFSFFNGAKIVENSELVLNIPVAIDNHVEYIVIHHPDSKPLDEIAIECAHAQEEIRQKEGELWKYLQRVEAIPSWIRKLYMKLPGRSIRFLRRYYGNFAISNFGSFAVSNGSLVLAQPMIASLCMCQISPAIILGSDDNYQRISHLPLSVVFDHRAVDGAYVGNFLSDVKHLLEVPDQLLATE